MSTYLDKILEVKRVEVAELKKEVTAHKNHPLHKILNCDQEPQARVSSFKSALKGPSLAVIAEIKRKSPSKGQIGSILDPLQLAKQYVHGGASAISILTDKTFFGGSLNDLQTVSNSSEICGKIPLLRKEFIIDPIQIAEAYLAGASAILLIVAAIGSEIGKMHRYAEKLGLDVLVEVHDREELKIALDINPQIIGVNNRNLSTFEVSLGISEKLSNQIPPSILKVSESGIHCVKGAEQMFQAGYNGILVGEALVKAQDPIALIQSLRNIK